jgi:DNA processing protein
MAASLLTNFRVTESQRLDAVALSLAAAPQPARAAAALKSDSASWPVVPLEEGLQCLTLHGPGAASHWRAAAARALTRATTAGYDVIWPAHPAYPPLLATIVDPPLLLWVRGDPAVLLMPAVALVGSRKANAAGRDVAFRLAADLAATGLIVSSGFARGIDAAAHRGALSTGRSLAVLGCGLDQPYPSEHGPLGCELAASGAVVSEFAPGAPPLAHHFPLRNRILSGLCRAVVVVQADHRSGSLITARLANEQGREVMAVPGDVRSGCNAGGHALIRDGARLVERASDILDELGWSVTDTSRRPSAALPTDDHEEDGSDLDDRPKPARLLRAVAREDGATLDDLLTETGRNSADLLGELLDLELAGLVRRDVAGRFLPVQRKW